MSDKLLMADAFAKVLGSLVAEKRKEFDQAIALRDAEFKTFQAEMRQLVHVTLTAATNSVMEILSKVRDGERGLPGERGEAGPQGLTGPAGPVGEKGFPGLRGEVGAVGPAGEKGATGEPGCPGERGSPGLQGPDGIKGESGRDGMAGRDGLNGLQGERGTAGTDGLNGKDGKDGVGFDDLQFEYDGERILEIIFISGTRTKRMSVVLPVPIYRGKWVDGTYGRGDEVSHGGNVFIALKDTDAKPPGDGWVIATNRGRDGRDGKDGAQGPQGLKGDPGQDLTQLGPDGKKWR